MELFGKNKFERDTTRAFYCKYSQVGKEQLCLRRIKDTEFRAVPENNKSKMSLMFKSRLGVFFIIVVIVSVWNMSYCFKNIMTHEKDAWMMLLIFSMCDLLFLVFSGVGTFARMDEIVTEDSLVLAGEVTEVHLNRGSKGAVISADHYIAIHGSEQMVMIENRNPIMTGSTVLIIKSPKCKYHLIEIPQSCADFDAVGENFGEELSDGTTFTAADLSEYEKITLDKVRKEPLTSPELSSIPYKFRGAAPFSHGSATVCWVIFTVIAIIMLAILHKARVERNAELFFPLLCGFLCEFFIELFITSAVMGKRLSNKMCYYFDCVVIRKNIDVGLGLISVIIPDRKQYIDALHIDRELYDSLPVNEPVRLYYNLNYPNARYARRLYNEY